MPLTQRAPQKTIKPSLLEECSVKTKKPVFSWPLYGEGNGSGLRPERRAHKQARDVRRSTKSVFRAREPRSRAAHPGPRRRGNLGLRLQQGSQRRSLSCPSVGRLSPCSALGHRRDGTQRDTIPESTAEVQGLREEEGLIQTQGSTDAWTT